MQLPLSRAASYSYERRPLTAAPLPSPALVLGATSLVGQFLIRRLVDTDIKALALSRRPHGPTPGVRWIIADLTDMDLRLDESVKLAFSVSPIWVLPHALPALHAVGVRRLVAFSSTSR